MSSIALKPYMLRAHHEWMVDSGHTPYLVVDASVPGVAVPLEHVKDGRIVLDISPQAVRGLALDNDGVRFSARFGGRPCDIFVPMDAVLAIFAKETGAGMAFAPEAGSGNEGDAGSEPPDGGAPPPRRPALRRVK